MAITLRSRREIEKIRLAGKIVAEVLLKIKNTARVGMTTLELNDIADGVIMATNSVALFKGVDGGPGIKPFPAATCISINEQVVHGIPSPDRRLIAGDLVSVDFGVRKDRYCGDAALSFCVGSASRANQRLLDVTRRVLDIAVEMMKPGIKWSVIAAQMQATAENAGFGVVRDLVGHGIGTELHAEPQVPNYAARGHGMRDFVLKEGMVLAVEPMITAGSYNIRTLKDGWTIVTVDGGNSAHFEHTIAVVNSGSEVLTSI